MNESALLAAVQDELEAQTWTGSSNVVFGTGSVLIVPDLAQGLKWALESGVRTPLALIHPAAAESDPEFNEEPDFIRFSFPVLLATLVPGGAVGEEAVMGANKTGGSTASEGRGIVEVSQEFYNAVGKLNALEAVTLQVRQVAEQGAAFKEPQSWIVYRIYMLEAFGSAT